MVYQSFLNKKISERLQQNALRTLRIVEGGIDFCSNDYLGMVKNDLISKKLDNKKWPKEKWHGSTGSRLLTGNYSLIEKTEQSIADFHAAEAGLIFNSGYDANLALLSCVPQRGDTILYDFLCHASIRDGIRLSFADHVSFEHNDLNDLEKRFGDVKGNVFVVTESVFSMDGDIAPLKELSELCESYHACLIIDEAHATGVFGEKGEGLVQSTSIEKKCFARINTFGKALGCHGAIVLGSAELRTYLVNFARPFIYSTALPAASVAAIQTAYEMIPSMTIERHRLQELVKMFRDTTMGLPRLSGNTAIQGILIPGNEQVKRFANRLQLAGIDSRAIVYPTVPKGKERLRIVLHSFNTVEEISLLAETLKTSHVDPQV